MAAPESHRLTRQIVVAMLAGIALGVALNLLGTAPWMQNFLVDGLLHVVGSVFVAALKLMVVPLVFVSLVVGVTALSDSEGVGRIGGKALGLYLATTAFAVALGAGVRRHRPPWRRLRPAHPDGECSNPKDPPPLTEILINLFPTNPVEAMAKGEMLQIIVFAVLFGLALTLSGGRGQRLVVHCSTTSTRSS